MVDLVKFVVNQFVENPDKVEYKVTENEKETNITIILEESDMGKVIGRQGKIAKALRTIAKCVAAKDNKKCNIEIKENGEV